MKKRIFAALVCVMMIMALLPATAFAANSTSVRIAGAELNADHPYYHNGASGAPGTVDNDETNNNAYFDVASGTLTLNGLVVESTAKNWSTESGDEYYAIYAEDSLKIIVDGDNRISVPAVNDPDKTNIFVRALYVVENLSVEGTGSLTAEVKGVSGGEGIFAYGVFAQKIDIASGATLTGLVSGTASALNSRSFGVIATASDITVAGGTLKGQVSGQTTGADKGESYGIMIAAPTSKLTLNAGSVEGISGSATASVDQTKAKSIGVNGSISVTGGSFTAKSDAATSPSIALSGGELVPGTGIAVKGSTSNSGTPYVTYNKDDNATYQWVSARPAVTTIAVNPTSVNVETGGNQTFSATVTGPFSPEQTVNWTVEGGVTGTSIDAAGKLTVAASETATTLTVKATSTLDSKKFNTATVTVTESTRYAIIQGENGNWSKDGAEGLGFTADADYSKFTNGGKVTVDGVEISSPADYSHASGSTIVTLKNEYLETLRAGRHTLRVIFADGYAETYFTVDAQAEVPQTGDGAQPALWLMIALTACAGLAVSVVLRRRRQNG